VRIVYARPASFQIQNDGCMIRIYWKYSSPIFYNMTSME